MMVETEGALGFRVYAVTPDGLEEDRLVRLVAEALEGGAQAVQLRDKSATTRELHAKALRLRKLTRDRGAVLVINDRLDVALAVDADGLHLGQRDLPAAAVRRIWKKPRILGVTAPSAGLVRQAVAAGADYVGAGPVFPTLSKETDGPPLGVEGLAKLARGARIPVVAIGGITPENCRAVAKSGVASLASIGGIFGHSLGPRKAVCAFLCAWDGPVLGLARERWTGKSS